MKGPIAAGLLALTSVAYAQVQKTCDKDIGQVCYSLNIPEATTQSGDGDIFFALQAPTSVSWVAFGQGSSMSGSNIFVVYASSDGKNVTLSPRLGTGHQEPQYSTNAQVELIGGSGVSNGVMTANVKCSNCNSWSGGSADFKTSTGDWIYAYKTGDAMNSDDKSASISQHTKDGSLSFDFSTASGGSSSNPLTDSSSSSSGSGSSRCKSSATSASGSSGASSTASRGGWTPMWGSSPPSGSPPPGSPFSGNGKRDSSDDDSCDDEGASSSATFGQNDALFSSRSTQMLMAHGILACLAFAIFFPMGAIVIRLLSFPGLLALHAAIQLIAYLMFIVAFGLGIYIANNLDMLNEYHPIIGIVLFILLFFQPILGALHHHAFKREGRRTFWSYGHLWLGRIIITLGIINGGLGFLLADNSTSGAIAYGVIAAVVWLAYVVAIFIGERRRKKSAPLPPKYSEVPPTQDEARDQPPVEYYADRHPK